MRLTVGPLPSAVYWRRRAIVLAGLLLALFLVAQACVSTSASPEGRGGGSEPSGSPSQVAEQTTAPADVSPGGESTQPTSDQPAEQPEQQPEQPGSNQPAWDPDDESSCTDEEMRIAAESEQTSYRPGSSVQFTILIKNRSDRSCQRDIGGGERELYLRQGTGATDKVWSSRDCNGPTGSDVQELTSGLETSYWIVWHGRSSDRCKGSEPDGQALEPGEYELVARLGTAYSKPLIITVRE